MYVTDVHRHGGRLMISVLPATYRRDVIKYVKTLPGPLTGDMRSKLLCHACGVKGFWRREGISLCTRCEDMMSMVAEEIDKTPMHIIVRPGRGIADIISDATYALATILAAGFTMHKANGSACVIYVYMGQNVVTTIYHDAVS